MKETGNAMIEEAIFILKSSSGSKETFSDADIIKHANAILDKGHRSDKFPFAVKEPKHHKALGFLAGTLTGALGVFFIMLVF